MGTRIAAKIQPEWVEPLAAAPAIKRSYSEPHWEKKQAAVCCVRESDAIYGIPIVGKRKVNYGQVSIGQVSRELSSFALRWWKEIGRPNISSIHQNRKLLLREVEELEHKSRRRDILIDDDQLFEFLRSAYRPQCRIWGVTFDTWWKKAVA